MSDRAPHTDQSGLGLEVGDLLAGLYVASVFSHPGQFLWRQGPLFQCAQVLVELSTIPGASKHSMHMCTGETESIANSP